MKPTHVNSITHLSNQTMLNIIERLSSSNQKLSETVNTLSQTMLLTMDDHQALRSKILTLNEIISSLSLEKQRNPKQPNAEPSNTFSYQPALFRQ